MQFRSPTVNCCYVSSTVAWYADQYEGEAKALVLRYDGEVAPAAEPAVPVKESSNEAAEVPKENAKGEGSSAEADEDSDDEFIYQWRRAG